jgi:hypothetical protein
MVWAIFVFSNPENEWFACYVLRVTTHLNWKTIMTLAEKATMLDNH